MRNKALIEILQGMNPNADICINIFDVDTGVLLDSTYDIGFSPNEFNQLVLEVNVTTKNNLS